MTPMRLAFRGLLRSRAVSAAVVVTLALTMAGATVVFALVRGVLLRPLPVLEPDRVVVAWQTLPKSGFDHYPFTDTGIAHVAAESRLFAVVGGVDRNAVGREVFVDGDVAGTVDGALVSGAFYDVLGVRPAAGRLLTAADDVDGAEPVLVISHAFFRRRFGGAADVIGRRVTLDHRRFTIVGVLPAGLDYPRGADVVRMTHTVPLDATFGMARRQEIDLVARLRPGVTTAQARQELEALTRRHEAEQPFGHRGFVPRVQLLADVVVGDVSRPLAALLAAVLLVLLLAAINAATLRLLEAERRRGELAVHLALGAGRARLVRRWLVENALLCGAAALAGGLAGAWGIQALPALLPSGLPRLDAVRIDAMVLGFLALASAVTAIALTAVPASLLARGNPIAWLGEAGRAANGAIQGWRRGLVVAQVALAVILVAGAALLVRTLSEAARTATGMPADRLVFVDLSMPTALVADRVRHAQLVDDLSTRLRADPEIGAVTAVNGLPYDANGWDVPVFTAEGQDAPSAAANPSLSLEAVGPRHFETLGIPIAQGRAFDDRDGAGAVRVAIVSDDVARRLWPGQEAVGRRVKFGSPESAEGWMTIVGVAADVRYRELRRPRPTVYVLAVQFIDVAQRLAVRTTLGPGPIAAAVRAALRPRGDVHLLSVTPFEEHRAGALVRPRFDAVVAGLFAVVAWLVAALGVHAVIAASVGARRRELAIRSAIGATPGDLRRLVIGEAVLLVGFGAAIGLAGGIAAGRTLAATLDGVRALDAWTLVIAVSLLVVAALVAIALPLRRAAGTDPTLALRT